jgi:hypothetical protein
VRDNCELVMLKKGEMATSHRFERRSCLKSATSSGSRIRLCRSHRRRRLQFVSDLRRLLSSTTVLRRLPVGQNQEQRISQGVQSGQLTGREANHLENREASIQNETQNMRAANGGHLTRSDRRTLNRQQNRTSAAIARDKHNARVR